MNKDRHRFPIFFLVLCVSGLCHANDMPAGIVGNIPAPDDDRFYRIQVGAFRYASNAAKAFEALSAGGLAATFENTGNLVRVLVPDIPAADVPATLVTLRRLGFDSVWIRRGEPSLLAASPPLPPPPAIPPQEPDPGPPVPPLPADIAELVLPPPEAREIGHRTVRVGETASLSSLAEDFDAPSWTSSVPEILAVDPEGNITGLAIGNAFVEVSGTEFIAVAVVPSESFFVVSADKTVLLPPESRVQGNGSDPSGYRTEPTFRLAYKFRNSGETYGASGGNGGIDILARAANFEWVWTTFGRGGWFYSLNGVMHEMVDGFQRDEETGVELTLLPEFVYEEGTPFLQLRHVLRNPGKAAVTGQKFGASADVMIANNDNASLMLTPEGARMTDPGSSMELSFIGLQGTGITPVDTLWLGTWAGGLHLDYVYSDMRNDVLRQDSAMAFSFQNIDLEPGGEKEFVVRFTLTRTGGRP
ncbi:MAG: SPOR domain-containing protein [Treponema sp.]|nr:SPOR domain-containing protein [Treponema sp.]